MAQIKNSFRVLDKITCEGLKQDLDIFNFWKRFFNSDKETHGFINSCVDRKIISRRMMLRAQWYSEIADGMAVVRRGRPALQVIFLMSIAEGLIKLSSSKIEIKGKGQLELVKMFFKRAAPSDKAKLSVGFKRALTAPEHHSLRFSSIIRIFYDIRSSAVHGEDFSLFSLRDKINQGNVDLLTTG